MASSSSTGSGAKRALVASRVLAKSKCTKTGLAHTLHVLHEEGLLHGDIGEGSEGWIRKSLTARASELAVRQTPFGQCIEAMQLTDDLVN